MVFLLGTPRFLTGAPLRTTILERLLSTNGLTIIGKLFVLLRFKAIADENKTNLEENISKLLNINSIHEILQTPNGIDANNPEEIARKNYILKNLPSFEHVLMNGQSKSKNLFYLS